MATAPDRTWEDLLLGLDENNIGAITEEDVRALAAYSRHSRYNQTFVDGADMDGWATWGSLPEPYTGVRWFKLQSRFASATNSYRKTSGSLASSTNGILYSEGDAEVDGAVQDRTATYSWNVQIDSPYHNSWGISWWRLLDGGTWPAHDDTWDMDEIELVRVQHFTSPSPHIAEGQQVWTAHGAGQGLVDLSPGDTLVPVLEYYGSYDSTGSNPVGLLRSLTTTASLLGPTADNEVTVGNVSARKNTAGAAGVRRAAAAGTNTAATGERSERIQFMPARPTTGLYPNLTVFETGAAGKLCIYSGTEWITFTRDA